MKIIILCSTLDLTKPYGSTPALLQLFKGLSEIGNELLILPYHGRSMNSLWWQGIENPNFLEGEILQKLMNLFGKTKRNKSSLIPFIARTLTTPKIEKTLLKVLSRHKDVDAILIINLPLNQIKGLSRKIKSFYNIPVLLYDIDVPTSLPSRGGFTFNHYLKADLDEYDTFIIPSEGSINELKELGAKNVDILHFGVDPSVYGKPEDQPKDIDLFFYGMGGKARQRNIEMMITNPSNRTNHNFLISGNDFNFDIGKSKLVPLFPFGEWKKYCARSKINLNVVRELHADIFATSTSRPFELAVMKCCIVSSPYIGLDKWFNIGKELLVVESSEEAIDVYQSLLADPERRYQMGLASYNRVIQEHTSVHRSKQLMEIIKKY